MVMGMFAWNLASRLDGSELPRTAAEGPPLVVRSSRSAHGSIQTMIVILAVITIVGVVAGIVARICGGRHFGRNGEHDIEGWVERKCRSCIDGGVPAAPPPENSKPAAEEAKK
uniref:Uncharacterized protein n=1 Tax=Nelumbo nucifera TaxID=4432 RepID=A0A822YDY7_NELNU|nr:TPA_asm: hypothetical protein HUJ06_031189 [Nelumbo nucifera]